MENFEKEGEEDFVDNIWKKLEFHKGSSRPQKNPSYLISTENKVEEEVIKLPEKPKKSRKPLILILLIVFVFLIVLFMFSQKEESSESSMPLAELKIPQDYVAYWKFEDNQDESGNYPAEFENGAFIFSDILRGKVLRLDGIDDYVNIGDRMGLENTEEITVSLWVKSEDVSHTIIGKDLIWKIDFDSYKLRFMTGDNWDNLLYSPVLDISEWIHILAVHEGSRKCFYINGNLSECVETFGGSFGDNAYPVIIGAEDNEEDAWKGLIDEVMIYDRGLQENEIKAIYELQKIEELPSISPFAKLWDKLRNLLS